MEYSYMITICSIMEHMYDISFRGEYLPEGYPYDEIPK